MWVIISITIFDLCAWRLCLCCCSDVGVECVFYLIFENSHGICEILSDNKLGYCYSVWTGNRVIEAGMNKVQESSPLRDAGEALDVARWERCSMCPIPRDPERPLTPWSQQHRISCILWTCELLNRFSVAGRLAPLPGIPWCPCSQPWLKLISLEISGAASDVDPVFTEGFVIRMEVATDRVTFLLLNIQGRCGSQCQ